MAKIKVSDVNKKHLKILAYLVGSAVFAYIVGVIADRPEAVYFSPVVNYIIFALEKELKKEGYVKALRK